MRHLALFLTTVAAAGFTASAAVAQTAAAEQTPAQGDPAGNTAGQPGAVAETPSPGSPATDPSQTDANGDVIVVTGVRASLRSAQQIKRNATQVVDSIVAEDIGKLPDNTVSDALQRVTGIQVYRGGGEVNSVLVRGLPDIETLINGREVFTGTGRGVSLADIPAELVAGIDVYKTNTPDMIEGSVSGTIDTRLRRPFDFAGFQIAGGARAFYGDKRDKWSYTGSALVSNRFDVGDGEFGVLLAASYNNRKYQDQTAFNFGFNPFTPVGGVPTLIPDTVGGLVTDGDRKRPAFNVSLQWRPSPNLELYADGLFTGYRQDYDVNFFVGLPKAGDVTINSLQPNPATIGLVSTPVANTITTRSNFTITSKQTFREKTDGYQGNFGGRYTAGRAVLSSEVTYSKSKVRSQQFVLDTAFIVPQVDYNFDVNGTPRLNFNGFDFTNTANLNLLTLFDNLNVARSRQYAGRADLLYSFEDSLLKNVKVGVRYASRKGSSGGTNGAAYPLGFLPGSGFSGLGANAPDDIINGNLGVDGFALASSDFLRSNIDQLRGLAGRPTGDPAFDPARVFRLKEDVLAGYAQVSFGFDAGSIPVEGVIGARLVNTKTTLNAILTTIVPATPTTPGSTTLTPITGKRNETNFLPSLTLKARPYDNIVVRAIVGKAILRPQFAQLNPATSLALTGITGGTSTGGGSGSGGNSNLGSVKSTNVDLGFEYYFSRASSFTVAGFYKKLNGYIQTYSDIEQQPGTNGQPAPFLIARPQNSGKGTLKGVEVAYTQFFDFLPGALSGFGGQANFTLAKGRVEAPPPATGNTDIIPLSKYSYNLVAIYEKYGLSMRLAYNWRSKYTDSFSTVIPGGRVVTKPLKFLDFSASYDINPHFTVSVDATNILNETYNDSFGDPNTPRDTRRYERTIGGGLRFRF